MRLAESKLLDTGIIIILKCNYKLHLALVFLEKNFPKQYWDKRTINLSE